MVDITSLVPAGGSAWHVVLSIAIVFVSGALGSIGMYGQMGWYDDIKRAALAPPKWVFGVVWPILYTCIGMAAYIVWAWSGRAGVLWVTSLVLYICQLVLGVAWTWLFFRWRDLRRAHYCAALYALVTGLCVAFFWAVAMEAGVTMLPVAAWTGFAWHLSAEYLRLNADVTPRPYSYMRISGS
jgi:benzodiazapine receptor